MYYWRGRNISLHTTSRLGITKFVTHKGQFMFRTMPFGLCNAPSTFQRYVDNMLTGLNWVSCIVYIDDIIVYSSEWIDHLVHLKEVMVRIRDAGLQLKL